MRAVRRWTSANPVTGFVVDSMEDAVAANRRVHLLNRRTCRESFERRFNVSRMATDYVDLYDALIARGSSTTTMFTGTA